MDQERQVIEFDSEEDSEGSDGLDRARGTTMYELSSCQSLVMPGNCIDEAAAASGLSVHLHSTAGSADAAGGGSGPHLQPLPQQPLRRLAPRPVPTRLAHLVPY